jgi:hypothetical protein
MSDARELPQYKSHKTVHALKIASIEWVTGTITPADEGYEPFRVPAAYINKHDPQPGGYYVVYEDGYCSFSPSGAFEQGYTRI